MLFIIKAQTIFHFITEINCVQSKWQCLRMLAVKIIYEINLKAKKCLPF